MFCTNCGKELEESWNICPNCGQKIKSRHEAVQSMPGTEPEAKSSPASYPNQGYSRRNNPKAVSGKGKNHLNNEDRLGKFDSFRFWVGSVFGITIGLGMILLGRIPSGILFILAAILLCPAMQNKFPWKKQLFLRIISVFLVALSVFLWNSAVDKAVKKAAAKQENSADIVTDEADSATKADNKIPDNDLENLLSCTPDEILAYGFTQSDSDEEYFTLEDGKVSVIYDNGKPWSIYIEDTQNYSFHGITPGMDAASAAEACKDDYSLEYQVELQQIFLSKDGKVIIITDLADNQITRLCGSSDADTLSSLEETKKEAALLEEEEAANDDTPEIAQNTPTDEGLAGNYNKFNFDGEWTDSISGRCFLSISCQNDVYYYITIHGSAGASDSCDWEFIAEYDNRQGALIYQNGRYTETHYPNGGSPQTVVKYTNGIGRIYPMDGKLYWDDQTEGAGDSCVFVR